MKVEQICMIASVLLLIAAAIFLWRNNLSVAFVTAALGACAWFLSYRAKIQNEIDQVGSGSDQVRTGSGSDQVRTGSGSDQVRTGSGSDRVENRDAQDED